MKSDWISTKKRLPPDNERVLTASKQNTGDGYFWYVKTDFRKNGKWVVAFDEPIEIVTHWMPLPELPEEDE